VLHSTCIATVLGLLGAEVPTTQPTTQPTARTSAWSAFGVGSYVVYKENSEGIPGVPKTTFTRSRVAAWSNGAVTLANKDGRDRGALERASEALEPHKPGGSPEALGMKRETTRQAEFTIEGRKVACTVTVYTQRTEHGQARWEFWRTSAVRVPYRECPSAGLADRNLALLSNVVRIDVRFQSADVTGNMEFRVVALADRLKIGSTEVPCVREEISGQVTVDGQRQQSGRITWWHSDAVPGHLVRRVVQEGQGEERERQERSVVEFRAVPVGKTASPEGDR